MSGVYVAGIGAVSPAGWGTEALRKAIESKTPVLPTLMEKPLWKNPLPHRPVPAPSVAPEFFRHARFRRTSPIAQYAMASAAEALGIGHKVEEWGRVGVVFCVMGGCVNYSRRFYDETLKDPSTASPLVFPETVFNAPASHIAAFLQSTAINYTIVGDQGTYLQGLAMAAEWLETNRVDACLVLASEEMDWMMVDSFHMFNRQTIVGAGAGAVLLVREDAANRPRIERITSPFCYSPQVRPVEAAQQMRAELPEGKPGSLLCDSRQRIANLDRPEDCAWLSWTHETASPKAILGEGLMASSAWQCVYAVDALTRGQYSTANISIVGSNQQAIGAHFSIAP